MTKNDGNWRGKFYPHILPKEKKDLNIIEGIRNDFWPYLNKTDIKLHQYFHHLNSSQALCFNLFFPLIKNEENLLTYLIHKIIE